MFPISYQSLIGLCRRPYSQSCGCLRELSYVCLRFIIGKYISDTHMQNGISVMHKCKWYVFNENKCFDKKMRSLCAPENAKCVTSSTLETSRFCDMCRYKTRWVFFSELGTILQAINVNKDVYWWGDPR